MKFDMTSSPLHGPAPAEVSLRRAPLARVIAQLRFPPVLMIGSTEAIPPLQERLRGEYPGFRRQEGQAVMVELTADGPSFNVQPTILWRFTDADEDWIVTLAVDALTLETRRYTSRSDLLARLDRLMDVLQTTFAPAAVQRVAVRYVTRVEGEGYARIHDLVRTDLLGLALPPLRDDVRQAISEAVMCADEGDVLLRWGVTPPGGSIDPAVLPPLDAPSWVIDIDVSDVRAAAFDRQQLSETFNALAARAYAVFRYVVTNEFLELYGQEA